MKILRRATPVVLVLILTIACGLFNLPSGSAPQDVNKPEGEIVVWHVTLLDGYYPVNTDQVIRLNSDSVSVAVKMSFSSMVAEISNGKVTGYYPAPTPKKVEYQLCFTTGETCEPQGEWRSDNEVKITDLNLDWRNVKNLTFRARFRDVSQKPRLSLNGYDSYNNVEKAPQEVSEINFSIRLVEPDNTETPEPLPPLSITQTYVATTSPVQGSIQVAPGVSVIGGTAGNTRQVQVDFSATSTSGKVTEMRLDDGNWESFVPQKEYTITIILNWSSIQHCVEYRDEKGNISPRYCDNKGVEGSPKLTP